MNYNGFKKKDIMKMLNILGLSVDDKTGGHYYSDYSTGKITKNNAGLYVLRSSDKKISFLNGMLFLSTVKMVENSLNYKLFK